MSALPEGLSIIIFELKKDPKNAVRKKVVSLFGKSKQGHNMFTPSENENNKHCISEIWNFDPKSECESEF